MDRKRLSGARYKTKAKEKAKKQAEVLTKTKTLQNYFSVPLSTLSTGERLQLIQVRKFTLAITISLI